ATLVSALRSSELCLGCHPAAENFGHAPGLGDAAARSVRLFGVEDFAERAQAGLVEVSGEGLEKVPCLLLFVRVKLCPGIKEWSDQPGPDGPLVIGGIARFQVAVIILLVVRIARRKGTQSD